MALEGSLNMLEKVRRGRGGERRGRGRGRRRVGVYGMTDEIPEWRSSRDRKVSLPVHGWISTAFPCEEVAILNYKEENKITKQIQLVKLGFRPCPRWRSDIRRIVNSEGAKRHSQSLVIGYWEGEEAPYQ